MFPTFAVLLEMNFIRALLLSFFMLAAFNGAAQDSSRTFIARRISEVVKIDGRLDEEAWKSAPSYSDFVQNLPQEGGKPGQVTEVRVLYDNYAVYVGAVLYDTHPDSILRELGSRDDDGVNADFFWFSIDPYNTRQDAFTFGVSAAGVQQDYKFTDETFDAVWYSAVNTDRQGWSLEFKIPYFSIRFPKEKVQNWAVQFARSIRRTRETDQWSLTPNGEANPLRFWGSMKGIENIEAPVRLSFTPYVSAYYIQSPSAEGYDNSYSYNAGADVKYGIDERFTLDMTLFPDFGQVQSDSKVKNLSYREVVYDENRPFFKEGVDLFNKGDFLFYSRRIGRIPSGYFSASSELGSGERLKENPGQVKLLNATKISGRTNNGTGIGFFNAVTDNAYAVAEDSAGNLRKILTEPLTNFNIFVVDQQLKNNSSLYFINTNVVRGQGYKDANVSGSGFTFFDRTSTYSFSGSGTLSQLFSRIPGEQASTLQDQVGYHYLLQARKASGRFQYLLRRQVFSNSFDSRDLGFFMVNNFVQHSLRLNYNQYKPSRLLRNSFNNIQVNYSQHYESLNRTAFEVVGESFNTLLSFHSFFFGGGIFPFTAYDYNEPRVPGRYSFISEYYYFFTGISSDYRKKLAIDLTLVHSNFLKSNANNFPALPGGEINSTLRYRFSNKLSVSYSLNYSYDPYNGGYAGVDTSLIIYGGRRLDTYVNTLSGRYIFTPTMFLNLNIRHYWSTGRYIDYYRLNDDGRLSIEDHDYNRNFSYNAFNIDLVYNWIFTPGSLLSVVYKNAIETDDSRIVHSYNKNIRNTLQSPQTNSISLRLLYFLDYQSLKKRLS